LELFFQNGSQLPHVFSDVFTANSLVTALRKEEEMIGSKSGKQGRCGTTRMLFHQIHKYRQTSMDVYYDGAALYFDNCGT
jgi:aerobic-type carbon monoxide dehydrogenase small subunit (CoxS/CutS family)